MNYKALVCFVFVFSSFGSCDDKLTLTKAPYSGEEIRIDGYYYRENTDYCVSVYFFYSDGTFIDAGCLSCKPNEIETYMRNMDWNQWRKAMDDSSIGYGIFRVSDNELFIEMWRPSSSWFSFPAYLYTGKVLNDSTFIIKKVQPSKPSAFDNETRSRHEIFRFKQFSPKPDSTNRFVPTGNFKTR